MQLTSRSLGVSLSSLLISLVDLIRLSANGHFDVSPVHDRLLYDILLMHVL